MFRRQRRLSLTTLAVTLCLLGGALAPSLSAGARGPRAVGSAGPFMTGIGDQQPLMFGSPLWQQLHTRIVRYIVPYDAVAHPYWLNKAIAWVREAEAQHQKVLIAFYHSESSPTRLPSVGSYKHFVQKFVKRFPYVRQYETWDEANRGNVPHLFSSPSARADAQYYQALIRSCTTCTVVGLDVLDQSNITPTLHYISEFKSEIGHLRTVMPRIWGLHNYADVNHFEGWRTREIVRALGGQVWLTETGGIVKFGGAFPNSHGAGLVRAANALKYMFALANSSRQIKRLYIFDWSGGNGTTRFDAGLTDNHHRPRKGYVVVCRALHAPHCNVRTTNH
jgi:hypothetical protein